MSYFNGSGGYFWLGKYVPLVPTDRIYCDECAETEIPLLATGSVEGNPRAGRHWNMAFSWAARYGGNAKCTKCGKPC